MNICFAPSDMDAPGCYRCLFPARALRQLGHKVYMPHYIEHVRESDGYKVVNFQVKFNPPDPMADIYVLQQRFERIWAEQGVPYLRRWGVATVLDVDDNYLELPAWNPSFRAAHPYRRDDGTILNRAQRRGKQGFMDGKGREVEMRPGVKVEPNKLNVLHMHKSMGQVDMLTVATPYLAELYGRLNKNVHVLRNMLDWEIWEDVQPQCLVERDRLRIGYSGVMKFRRGDLELLKNVIPRVMKRHPEIDFVANSTAVHEFLGVPPEQRVNVGEYPFRPVEGKNYQVGQRTATMDIGLVPLAPGGFNEAKSHLKGMEYNAAGIPFIATPTESYRDYWCDEGENGFLASGPKEWEEHLEFLIKHDEDRRTMGKLGRFKASRNTYQKQGHQWEQAYASLVGDEYTRDARLSITVGAVQKVTEFASMLREIGSRAPTTVVEIGTARGGAFWALCRVADEKATLVSIDLVGGSPLDVRGGKDVYTGRIPRERIAAYAQPEQKAIMLDMSSQEESTVEVLRKALDGRQIECLFIDGDHRYEGVRKDYDLYEPLVAPGGLIFFHDITVQNDSRSGVHILWPEVRSKYRVWKEFIGLDDWGLGHWGGIGMVVKGG